MGGVGRVAKRRRGSSAGARALPSDLLFAYVMACVGLGLVGKRFTASQKRVGPEPGAPEGAEGLKPGQVPNVYPMLVGAAMAAGNVYCGALFPAIADLLNKYTHADVVSGPAPDPCRRLGAHGKQCLMTGIIWRARQVVPDDWHNLSPCSTSCFAKRYPTTPPPTCAHGGIGCRTYGTTG